jgi:hypothetical protein
MGYERTTARCLVAFPAAKGCLQQNESMYKQERITTMKAKIQKWGNSLGIRIPRSLAEETSVEDDSLVDISSGPMVGGHRFSPIL